MRKLRWLFVTACLAAACATQGTADSPVDAGLGADGGVIVDAGADADAAPCADCEFFPAACDATTFCSNGPFDPSTQGGAFDIRTQVNVIVGRSASDVWAAGALGALAHFDGTSWSRSDPGTEESMRALWLRDTGEVAFLRLEALFSKGVPGVDAGPDASVSDGGWTSEVPSTYDPSYSIGTTILASAWGAPGAEWLWVATRQSGPLHLSGLWRLHVAANGSFEVGQGLDSLAFTDAMVGIHGISADDLWAVGNGGVAVHVEGAQSKTPTFERFDTQTFNELRGVYAVSDTDVWAVGARGTIRHYTGGDGIWDIVADVPTTLDLDAVSGSSASDVWAVGNAGVVLHYDGKSWSRVGIAGLGARRPDLDTVWIPSAGHVWIGGSGVVLALGGKP